jgi:translation initiation factor 2B subunit (eIF-2B alpha/beta/delta family)
VLNKTGSLNAALAARHMQKPLYVPADTFKISPLLTADQAPMEGHPLNEIWPENPQVCSNNYFESVPPELITGYITEVGLLNREGMQKVIKRCSKELAEL